MIPYLIISCAIMIKRTFLTILLLIILTPFQAGPWASGQSLLLTDDVQMALGDAFMADGDYYRAITEYKKLSFLFPNSERRTESLYQIGMAYYLGKDFESAISSFAKVRKTYDSEYFGRAAFYEALSYEKLGNNKAAADAYERARFFKPDAPEAADAHLGLTLNSVEQNNMDNAITLLNEFQTNFDEDERAHAIDKAFILIDEYEATQKKSPTLAASLSAILPGSGQIYAGRKKDGLMSFLVNGLFIAGTVAAVNNENYALAAIVGGVGLPFYIGNIYGGANAAKKWNLSLSKQLRDDLSIMLNYHF